MLETGTADEGTRGQAEVYSDTDHRLLWIAVVRGSMKTKTSAVFAIAVLPFLWVGAVPIVNQAGNLERAVAFVVLREAQVNHLENRTDLCLAFGSGATVDEAQVISELRRRGVRLHPTDWCNHGPRGFRISVIPPIKESTPGVYEFTVELSDLSQILRGEHFATLLRQGDYRIESAKGLEPKLISYKQTCCPKTNDAGTL